MLSDLFSMHIEINLKEIILLWFETKVVYFNQDMLSRPFLQGPHFASRVSLIPSSAQCKRGGLHCLTGQSYLDHMMTEVTFFS